MMKYFYFSDVIFSAISSEAMHLDISDGHCVRLMDFSLFFTIVCRHTLFTGQALVLLLFLTDRHVKDVT